MQMTTTEEQHERYIAYINLVLRDGWRADGERGKDRTTRRGGATFFASDHQTFPFAAGAPAARRHRTPYIHREELSLNKPLSFVLQRRELRDV